MQYSQQQLQSILNSTVGAVPNQDENGCPWANQHHCPTCGGSAPAPTTPTTPTIPIIVLPPHTGGGTGAPGFSTTWPFFPGFPGGCYPPAPPTTVPPQSTWPSTDIPPNQDENGCPWATQHYCPTCGAASAPVTPYPLSQNPLVTNAVTPSVFPTGIAPSVDQNGFPLINGYSIYG
ncbi:hypothetical protein FACS1894184_18500 [Clostridia bacterium]|nr:hypothetical protein FACS1894184_18500 [Clostridia bacterium]